MLKQIGTQGTLKKRLKLGSLLLLTVMLVSVGGCNRGPTVSDQTQGLGQPQSKPKTQTSQQFTPVNTTNPALDATMNVNRLLNNTENALTKEQKDKLRPIFQDLNNVPSQSREALQKSANAINDVFTDKQRSFLNNGTAGTPGTAGNGGTTGTPGTGKNGVTPATPLTPGSGGVAPGTFGETGNKGTNETNGVNGVNGVNGANGANGVNGMGGAGKTLDETGEDAKLNAQDIYRKVLDALK